MLNGRRHGKVLRLQDWVGVKFLTFTGSPVKNEISYLAY